MKRVICWWKGHEYVVVHSFAKPLNINVVCLRCLAGVRDEGVPDPTIDAIGQFVAPNPRESKG